MVCDDVYCKWEIATELARWYSQFLHPVERMSNCVVPGYSALSLTLRQMVRSLDFRVGLAFLAWRVPTLQSQPGSHFLAWLGCGSQHPQFAKMD